MGSDSRDPIFLPGPGWYRWLLQTCFETENERSLQHTSNKKEAKPFPDRFHPAGYADPVRSSGLYADGENWHLWSISLGMVLMATTPKIPPRIFLQRQGAVYLSPMEAAGLYEILEQLCRRARVPNMPKLFLMKSEIMNAFSMGQRKDAAIVVTDALLRKLDWRETAGILAHEVGHIGNNDLFLHSIADTMTRVTSLLSTFGQILFLLYLPLLLFSDTFISPVVLLLLLFAPTISSLLQLALSRTREFELIRLLLF